MDPITRALLTEFVSQRQLGELPIDEAFEHFAGFSVVSLRYPEEFSSEDIVVGGGNDLSIDAIGIIVNGRLIGDLQEVDDLLSANGYLDVEFVFVQAKTSSNFDGSRFSSFCDNVRAEFFSDNGTMPVNDDVAAAMDIKTRIFNHAAKFKGNPECRLYYVYHWSLVRRSLPYITEKSKKAGT